MDDDEYDSPWNNYVPTQTSTEPQSDEHGKHNTLFAETGGDSLTAVSAYLELQQQGLNVEINEFLHKIFSDSSHGSNNPSHGSNNQHSKSGSGSWNYVRKDLSSISQEEAQKILSESFATKNPLCYSGNLSVEAFRYKLQRVWPALHRYSFVLVDGNNVTRGVATNADVAELSRISSSGFGLHLLNIYAFLDSITERASAHYPPGIDPDKTGTVIEQFLFGTPVYNTAKENVAAMYQMVSHSHEEAKANGFKMSIAQNSSSLTQQLAELSGCKRLLTEHPKTWRNSDGQSPFLNCPDSYCVTVDIKEY